ncbi:MAG: (R)-methylmalonyl-CoA mutase, adenosylcobamide-binding subunit [Bacteriovoracaceae bacterium]|nr:(R)-methylmalonyl-CoA mutase, adenosylcobamide-binding subunit [Bacteriovoracaceae bacterium]
MKKDTPIRVLMGKMGLDGHDRGAKVVMSALRDAGMEVIYSGLHQTPKALIRAAVEEDVDLIGISILSGSHGTLVPKLMKELKEQKMGYVPVYIGGIIPDGDIPALKKAGIKRVFTPGTTLSEIVDWAKKDAIEARKAKK